MDQNEEAKKDLVSLLNQRRALLMVGPWSSAFVGYPTWKQLLAELLCQFAPNILPGTNEDNATLADRIKEQARTDGRLQEYYKFLERTFQPKQKGGNHTNFHVQLVQLGFCGVTTLNYDSVLESATNESSHTSGHHVMPEAIDLCAATRWYKAFDFLQSLGPTSCRKYVLHLHGHYTNPSRVILTRKDYRHAYGEREISLVQYSPAADTQRACKKVQNFVFGAIAKTHYRCYDNTDSGRYRRELPAEGAKEALLPTDPKGGVAARKRRSEMRLT